MAIIVDQQAENSLKSGTSEAERKAAEAGIIAASGAGRVSDPLRPAPKVTEQQPKGATP